MARRLSGLVSLGILAGTAAIMMRKLGPPPPRPADAPATEFSATRAQDHISRFATHPHPVGTAEHARVRDYLADQLRGLGLRTDVEEAVGRAPLSRRADRPVLLCRASNIVAVLPGTDPTGRVYLAAHYDSVPCGPGASDDGVGTAGILETARALVASGVRPRNDIVFLLTDAEEPGLLGAEAFIAAHQPVRENGVVLNWDARGVRGPVWMFRSSNPNGGLIRTFASAAPYPVADSALAELAARIPSDTDLSAFMAGGLAGLDSGFINGGGYFHSPLDDLSHVDLPTLQQAGSNMLALAAAFGDIDLATLSGRDEMAYFNALGALIRYPVWAAVVLSGLALAATATVIVVARRRRLVTVRRGLAGALTALLPLTGAVGSGLAYWPALVRLRRGYAGLLTSNTYRPEFFQAGLLSLIVTICLAWYAVARRRIGPAALAQGALTWPTLLGVALAGFSPAAAHVMTVPALSAALGRLLGTTGTTGTTGASRRTDSAAGSPASPVRQVAITAGLLPGAVMLAAGAWRTLPLGLRFAGFVPAPLAALFLGLCLPIVEDLWPTRRPIVAPLGAGLVTAALTAIGLAVNRVDNAHPTSTTLRYALDADTREARWTVFTPPDSWNGRYLGAATSDHPFTGVWGTDPLPVGRAEPAPLAPPELIVTADRTRNGLRTLRLLLRPVDGGTSIGLSIDDSMATIRHFEVAGREISPGQGFTLLAPDSEGEELTLVVTPRGGPIRLRVVGTSADPDALREVPGYTPPPDSMYLLKAEASVVKTHLI